MILNVTYRVYVAIQQIENKKPEHARRIRKDMTDEEKNKKKNTKFERAIQHSDVRTRLTQQQSGEKKKPKFE